MKLRLEIPASICFTVEGDNEAEIIAKATKLAHDQFGEGVDLYFDETEGARLYVSHNDLPEMIDEEDDDEEDDEDEEETQPSTVVTSS